MPSAKSIQDIKTNLLNPALTSLYYVTIGKPDKLKSYFDLNIGNTTNQEKLNLMCCEATLPGSNLATLELTNDRTGVTERHAYRRVYDDRIDLTFYVDAENYLPIRFFETWIKYISQESIAEHPTKGESISPNYFYSFQYPNNYMDPNGLTVTKFEKSSLGNEGKTSTGGAGKRGGTLTYTFIRSFPVSINSMPVSYDSSSLLKCTVSMSYIRYLVKPSNGSTDPKLDSVSDSSTATRGDVNNPLNAARITAQDQAAFNSGAGVPDYFLKPQYGVSPLQNQRLNIRGADQVFGNTPGFDATVS